MTGAVGARYTEFVHQHINHQHINGAWRSGSPPGRTMTGTDPYTNETLTEIVFADAHDVGDAYEAGSRRSERCADRGGLDHQRARAPADDLQHGGVARGGRAPGARRLAALCSIRSSCTSTSSRPRTTTPKRSARIWRYCLGAGDLGPEDPAPEELVGETLVRAWRDPPLDVSPFSLRSSAACAAWVRAGMPGRCGPAPRPTGASSPRRRSPRRAADSRLWES